MIGGNEMEKGVLSVKNMDTGEQKDMSLEELVEVLKA
jgi:histidyl-tRNA synthetase